MFVLVLKLITTTVFDTKLSEFTEINLVLRRLVIMYINKTEIGQYSNGIMNNFYFDNLESLIEFIN